MKKYLLLLASAALLLVGCAKEQLSNGVDGGMTQVSFTTSVDGGVATKAAIDGDGNGSLVNRCIMEIYFDNQRYKRMVVGTSDTSPHTATFANVPVVAGKQYQVLFWADHVDNPNDSTGLATDKYYNTTDGLKAVTVIKGSFIDALEDKCNDYLDAFFFADNYTVPQAGGNYTDIKLNRPFAQLNVITTDVGENKTVFEENLLPEKVYVSYQAANKINVATGEISKVGEVADYTYSYEADVYGAWSTVTTDHKELTLSMDYILAPKTEQGAIDVTFVTKNGGQPVMTHALANLPYKRNYRTNVKGDLLTVAGNWTATIDPIWAQPDIVKVVEVADIKSANEIINQYAGTTDNLEVKFTGEPNDSGVPSGKEAGIRAIVTTPIKENASLSIEVLTQTKQLYIGDYKDEYIVTGEDFIDNSAKHAVVNVNVPQSSAITALVINAPSKSVYINGKEVANVGTITDLDAITSQNTLIIEKGQTVTNLTIRQGGLEIHGTVGTLEIKESDHEKKPVLVRTSENLSQEVFDVIYKEEGGEVVHDYIDRPNFSEKQNTDGTWDIIPSVCKIGETAYGSLNAAVAAIPAGGSGEIIMISNCSLSDAVTIPSNKTVILELNGKTINYVIEGDNWNALITNLGNLTIKDVTDISLNGSGTGVITADALSPDLQPVPGYASNTITNKGTLTIASGSIVNICDAPATYPIDNITSGSQAKLVIDGGHITGINVGLRTVCFDQNSLNEVTINGGIIEGGYSGMWIHLPNNNSNIKTNYNININGGTFIGKYAFYDYSYGESFENAKYVINGGKFNGYIFSYGANINIVDGDFQEEVEIEQNKPSKISVSGGKFKTDIFTSGDNASTSYITSGVFTKKDGCKWTNGIADGYAVVANTDATTKAEYPYTVKVKPVVKIGDVEYADIADAFAAVPTDGTATTVTLLKNIGSKDNDNIVWEEYNRAFAYTINDGQNITFDLNGKKIYAKTTVNGYTGFMLVKNGGSLTIKDSAGGGELNYLDGKDNEGGLAISSEGKLTIESGTIENHTKCNASAIQGAIDVHANEWGTPYAHHVTFTMNGGVLKSNDDNTLRIYDSSQTGKGTVVFDFEINGGEIYGADAIFIMTQWTKTYCTGDTYMNNINVSVKGGKFVTNNGIRVVGNVGEKNNKDYSAIKINVSGGQFTNLANNKYREYNVAFQNSGNWESTDSATEHLRSYTDVDWTTADPTYPETN